MPKNRINDQQQRRIKNIQQKRREKVADNQQHKSDKLSQQGLGPEQSGLVITNYGRALIVEDKEKKLHRCVARRNLGSLVCGDQVIWQAALADNNEGVVVAVEERQSLLQKPGFGGKLKPMAANIDQIIIVSAVQPEPKPYLIDRYLIAAENLPATPIILINKIDLLDDKNKDNITKLVNDYQNIGYKVITSSKVTDSGFDDLLETLQSHTSIFVGLSGVGKSSLINHLMPELNIRVGELSAASGEGTHTTTSSTLYTLPCGGILIDSPGVRDFGLWNSTAEDILHGYIEFKKYIGHCKFSNCSHQHEPGCAIQQALKDGEISQLRFNSYLKTIKDYTT
ncbi:MAG: small ribosomal subunit biogenesis GTPase RsgA [Gammaproteobacteria bacterium]|nr:small ribosomal subunit biogenesis GTPase RsgA [Gammaproteobacteria bacterium]